MAKNVKISFLGGVGEIGKNMTVLECEDDMIVLDAGLGFPTDNMPGIDCVVQDITYLVQNKDKVKAYVVTHGHEDHIGGLPYALAEVPAPVYASRLTLALLDNKLREHPGIKVKAIAVKPRSVITIGVFSIEFVHVNHSIPGTFALSINTPVGIILMMSDFKIDYTPVDAQTTDLTRIGEIGKKGVALMLAESTNIERPGNTISETSVGEKLDGLFAANVGRRMFIATFASNVHRVQQLVDLAEKYKRKIVFCGRSMVNVSDVAVKIGEMRAKPEGIIDISHIGNYKDGELLFVLTGSQGEPRSALVRMSQGEFQKVHIGTNDTIIFSSSPIPGNEGAVNDVVNNLIKRGAEVVYESLAEVHASGHAHEEEFKLIHTIVRPHFFMPIHGEYKHLKKHVALAQKLGMNSRTTLMPDLGDCFELSPTNLKRIGSVPSGNVLIDGSGSGSAESTVLRDRVSLSEDGICVIGIGYNSQTGAITSGPDVMTRGLLYSEEMIETIEETKAAVIQSITDAGHNLAKDDIGEIRNTVRKDIQNFFFKRVKRKPLVITMLQSTGK